MDSSQQTQDASARCLPFIVHNLCFARHIALLCWNKNKETKMKRQSLQRHSLCKSDSYSQYALHTLATHFSTAYSLFTIPTHKAQDVFHQQSCSRRWSPALDRLKATPTVSAKNMDQVETRPNISEPYRLCLVASFQWTTSKIVAATRNILIQERQHTKLHLTSESHHFSAFPHYSLTHTHTHRSQIQ